jgi:hypothetical protein
MRLFRRTPYTEADLDAAFEEGANEGLINGLLQGARVAYDSMKIQLTIDPEMDEEIADRIRKGTLPLSEEDQIWIESLSDKVIELSARMEVVESGVGIKFVPEGVATEDSGEPQAEEPDERPYAAPVEDTEFARSSDVGGAE